MLVFPYYLGKEINGFSSALLWDGKLEIGLPGWVSEAPLETFKLILNRASITNDPLLQILNSIAQIYMHSAKVGFDTINEIKPLDSRIKKVLQVYPGNAQSYEEWIPYMESDFIRAKLVNISQYPGMLGVISVEFIWRVYECYLEEQHDPDKVLANLNRRASLLGSVDYLLFESILNRMQIFRSQNGKMISPTTNIEEMLDLLSFGCDSASEQEIPFDNKVDLLAFTMFDKLLNTYTPKMDYKGSTIISEMFKSHFDELSLLKEKCKEESERLIVEKPDEKAFRFSFNQSIKSMESELESLVNIDKNALKSLYRTVTEDASIWVLLSGLIGSITVGASPIITAGAGVTALSKVGTTALNLHRRNKGMIENSEWSFIYHLSKKNV